MSIFRNAAGKPSKEKKLHALIGTHLKEVLDLQFLQTGYTITFDGRTDTWAEDTFSAWCHTSESTGARPAETGLAAVLHRESSPLFAGLDHARRIRQGIVRAF